MPLIDPKTAEPCTIGYLPPSGAFEFDMPEDFDWYKSPASQYVLGDDRNWYRVESKESGPVLSSAFKLYDNWPEAIRAALEKDMAEADATIAEANKDLAKVRDVRMMLNKYLQTHSQ